MHTALVLASISEYPIRRRKEVIIMKKRGEAQVRGLWKGIYSGLPGAVARYITRRICRRRKRTQGGKTYFEKMLGPKHVL